MTIPVNITLQYSETSTAGKTTAVLVDLFKVPGGASFSISYGFTLGGTYKVGWGKLKTFELLNYENTYEFLSFEVPMDPVPLTEIKFPLPLYAIPVVGPAISLLFGIDMIMAPQLDVDISADLFFDGLGSPSVDKINFKTAEQQSFTIDVDSFSENKDNVRFGLTNFSMDFYLSLLWSLQVKLKGFLGILGGPWGINIFTYPRIPSGDLPTTGETYGLLNISPTDNLPSFSLDTYYMDDGGNGILEPGETGSIFADFNNIGNGPAINSNLTVNSQNITLVSGDTGEYIFNSNQDNSFSHEVSFTLAGGYTQRNITVYYDITWLAANGSIRSQQEELMVRVLQPGEAYLSLDQWSSYEPNDGIWDADETVRIDIDVSKIGSGDVIYAELEILGVYSDSFYSSNDTFDFTDGSFSTWNSSSMFLTAPSDITEKYVDVLIGIAYELFTGEIYIDYLIITFDISPLSAKIDLVQVYGSLVSGDDDGLFMAGETFSMTATLENIGNDISGPIVGGFYTGDPDIIFQTDDLMDWNSIFQVQTI